MKDKREKKKLPFINNKSWNNYILIFISTFTLFYLTERRGRKNVNKRNTEAGGGERQTDRETARATRKRRMRRRGRLEGKEER